MYRSMAFALLATCILIKMMAEESQYDDAVTGMTLNGSTGLFVVPDAQIGWDRTDIGLNSGYGFVWTGNLDHLPRFSINLFRKIEVSGLLHFNSSGVKNGVLGAKFQFFEKQGASLAMGGDFEITDTSHYTGHNSKVYTSVTYSGDFFSMPATTSLAFGWQFLSLGKFSSQLIYGMGFTIGLFPNILHNYLMWVTDFSNFSYAVHGSELNAGVRGALNTGLRIHPVKKGAFNLVIDIIGTDLLDTTRGLTVSLSAGIGLKTSQTRLSLPEGME